MSVPSEASGKSIPVCQVIGPEHASTLTDFFERLRAQEVDKYFHPHPLTAGEAAKRAAYCGRDFYCVLVRGHAVIGYGMLRGWDEGYEVPSLGIVIDPDAQGSGFGRALMEFLHTAARQRGAKLIRLRVHPGNGRAVALYRSLGYVFEGEEAGQVTGFLALGTTASPAQDGRVQ